jgi:hypothetical protein
MKQLVTSFFRNDPYFPRPYVKLEKDRELWKTFGRAYLKAAHLCVSKGKLPEEDANLPAMFLNMVEVEHKRRVEAVGA